MNDGINRIKELAKGQKDKALLKVVEYLISRTDMNDKYLNPQKDLKNMCEFIKSEAQKQAVNGMAMIEDSEVYGWAIHYFDESNEDLKILPTVEKADISSKVKIEKRIEKVDNTLNQLSLFD